MKSQAGGIAEITAGCGAAGVCQIRQMKHDNHEQGASSQSPLTVGRRKQPYSFSIFIARHTVLSLRVTLTFEKYGKHINIQ